jgi:hypothetical protein
MRYLIIVTLALACAITVVAVARRQVAVAGEQHCDRDCLRGFVGQYLDALVAHAPGRLPVTPTVRFTEDGAVRSIGDGLWKTATQRRAYRQDVIDVRAGVAGTHTIVEENGSPALFLLRLKVADRRISEIETMVVRSKAEGVIFEPAAFVAPNAAMTVTPAAAQRMSREHAIAIAESYPAGLRAGSFIAPDVPFAADAYRFENGQQMAGPGCTFRPDCTNIKTQKIPTLPDVTDRVAAVDEEQGIVWLRQDFGAGSVPNRDNTLIVWEMFKVYGGRIHAVEALMEQAPRGSSSGWDGRAN